MLDNLVFYYDHGKYDKVVENLKLWIHCFKVQWELTQVGGIWKKCFSILITDPFPLFINNFHSYGEDASLRAFPLQFHWFSFVNMKLGKVNDLERRELKFMLNVLDGIEVKRWHFELTLCLGRSQAVFEHIIKPLIAEGWKISQLQPDPEKILYRDKFSLWHLVDPTRKLVVKGYVANAAKYPKCFENMTKVELVLPVMDFKADSVFEVLRYAHYIREVLISEELKKETRQIVWAKAILNPMIFSWFNNSNTLSLAWFFLKSSQQEITPFPSVYASQDETLELLKQTYQRLLKQKEEGKDGSGS